MSPNPPDDASPELTPAEELEIASLLAEAGGPAELGLPLPADVGARLDRVLAELVADRDTSSPAEPDRVAPVVVLESRRRRWPRALLAAAAVVVAGYGVSSALQGGIGMSGQNDSAAESVTADDEAGSGADTLPESAQRDGPADSGSAGAGAGDDGSGNLGGMPVDPRASLDATQYFSELRTLGGLMSLDLRPADLEDDVRSLLRSLPTRATALTLAKNVGCLPDSAGPRDRVLPVTYDGRQSVLVISPKKNGHRVVRVFSCPKDQLLAYLLLRE